MEEETAVSRKRPVCAVACIHAVACSAVHKDIFSKSISRSSAIASALNALQLLERERHCD